MRIRIGTCLSGIVALTRIGIDPVRTETDGPVVRIRAHGQLPAWGIAMGDTGIVHTLSTCSAGAGRHPQVVEAQLVIPTFRCAQGRGCWLASGEHHPGLADLLDVVVCVIGDPQRHQAFKTRKKLK